MQIITSKEVNELWNKLIIDHVNGALLDSDTGLRLNKSEKSQKDKQLQLTHDFFRRLTNLLSSELRSTALDMLHQSTKQPNFNSKVTVLKIKSRLDETLNALFWQGRKKRKNIMMEELHDFRKKAAIYEKTCLVDGRVLFFFQKECWKRFKKRMNITPVIKGYLFTILGNNFFVEKKQLKGKNKSTTAIFL